MNTGGHCLCIYIAHKPHAAIVAQPALKTTPGRVCAEHHSGSHLHLVLELMHHSLEVMHHCSCRASAATTNATHAYEARALLHTFILHK